MSHCKNKTVVEQAQTRFVIWGFMKRGVLWGIVCPKRTALKFCLSVLKMNAQWAAIMPLKTGKIISQKMANPMAVSYITDSIWAPLPFAACFNLLNIFVCPYYILQVLQQTSFMGGEGFRLHHGDLFYFTLGESTASNIIISCQRTFASPPIPMSVLCHRWSGCHE